MEGLDVSEELSELNSDKILLRMLRVRTVLLSSSALKARSMTACTLGVTSDPVRTSHMDDLWSCTDEVNRTRREALIRSVLARRASSAADDNDVTDSLEKKNTCFGKFSCCFHSCQYWKIFA